MDKLLAKYCDKISVDGQWLPKYISKRRSMLKIVDGVYKQVYLFDDHEACRQAVYAMYDKQVRAKISSRELDSFQYFDDKMSATGWRNINVAFKKIRF